MLEAASLWVTELQKKTDRSRKLACRTLILLWVSLEVSPGICSAGSSSSAEFEFDIPAGPAFDTLQKFIAISHIHMVYDFGLQQKTNEVHGRFSPEVALLRMLKDSGLVCSLIDGARRPLSHSLPIIEDTHGARMLRLAGPTVRKSSPAHRPPRYLLNQRCSRR